MTIDASRSVNMPPERRARQRTGSGGVPDEHTAAVCGWLGAERGLPFEDRSIPREHDAYPLVCSELGEPRSRLLLAARWLRLQEELLPCLERLERDGAGCAWAYKGVDYAMRLYPSPSVRPMSDADLLLAPEALSRLDSILQSDGWSCFSPGWSMVTSKLVAEVKYLKRGLLLELHAHPLYYPFLLPGRPPQPEEMETGLVRLAPGLLAMGLPCALVLQLLQMSLSPCPRQIWWVDVNLLLRSMNAAGAARTGWKEFCRMARRTGVPGLLAGVLGVASGLPFSMVPDRVIRTLDEDPHDRSDLLRPLLKGRRGAATLLALRMVRDWRLLPFAVASAYRIAVGRRPQIPAGAPGAFGK
ncbi:nucleotidyltransferase family protein [Candidatus Fermentibacterales bacterium]|nr:nucleotidyltransferase family protein [Candidatus Fermentibacterales bacterium]